VQFTALVNDVNFFATILKKIAKYSKYAHIDISEKMLRLWGLDTFEVFLLEVLFGRDFFESYRASSDFSFKVNVEKLGRILDSLKGKDKFLKIYFDDKFLYFSQKEKGKESIIKLKCWSDIRNRSRIPSSGFLKVETDSKHVVSALEQLSNVSDRLLIEFNPKNKLIILTSSQENLKVINKIFISNFVNDAGSFGTKITKMEIVLEYLKTLTPLMRKSSKVIFGFAGQSPMLFEIPIDDRNVNLRCYLSSRKIVLENVNGVEDESLRGRLALEKNINLESVAIKILSYLSDFPEGIGFELLKKSSVDELVKETVNILLKKDILSLGDGNKLILSPEGKVILRELKKNEEKGRRLLKKLLYSRISE